MTPPVPILSVYFNNTLELKFTHNMVFNFSQTDLAIVVSDVDGVKYELTWESPIPISETVCIINLHFKEVFFLNKMS